MGLFDWIRDRLGSKRGWEHVDDDGVAPESAPAPEPVVAEAPAPAAPKKKAAPPKAKKAPAQAKPVAAAKKDSGKKRKKKRKKRKGTGPSPMVSPKRAAAQAAPDAEVLTVAEAERRYGALVAAAQQGAPPAEVPAAEPDPVGVVEPPPSREPVQDGPQEDPDSYRAWVVVPQLEEALAAADATLADDAASRAALKTAHRTLRDAFRRLGPVPSDRPDLSAGRDQRLSALQARVDAIPDPVEAEREANAAQKRAMIDEVVALADQDDLRAAVDRVKELQRAWRDVGLVPKDEVAELRDAWKAACDVIFARREADREARFERCRWLVKQAEALGHARDPVAAGERMKALQADWKAAGGLGRGEEADALWAAFRAAADAVFERRRTHVAAEHDANLAKKHDLIDRALAMAAEGVEDPDAVIAALQKDWRRIGHVPREHGDAVWSAFRDALDRLRRPPEVDQQALGDGASLSFSPFAGLDVAPDTAEVAATEEIAFSSGPVGDLGEDDPTEETA